MAAEDLRSDERKQIDAAIDKARAEGRKEERERCERIALVEAEKANAASMGAKAAGDKPAMYSANNRWHAATAIALEIADAD